jgi:hypothetical protein
VDRDCRLAEVRDCQSGVGRDFPKAKDVAFVRLAAQKRQPQAGPLLVDPAFAGQEVADAEQANRSEDVELWAARAAHEEGEAQASVRGVRAFVEPLARAVLRRREVPRAAPRGPAELQPLVKLVLE